MPHTGPSGFAEIALVPACAVHVLPPEIDFELGALVEPLSVGLHAINRVSERAVHRLLIIGAGTIGMCTLLCAKEREIEDVRVMARYPHQAILAGEFGATGVLCPDDDLLQVMDDKPDAIISSSTSGESLSQAISICRRGGMIVLLGGFSNMVSVNLRPMISKELHLIGSICYAMNGEKSDFHTILDWLAMGKIQPRALITHRFAFSDIAAAFETARKRSEGAIKVTVQMSRDTFSERKPS
jgi:2-desacetyl-2-hydroxyethyl bacteriochlorophyllide A dehydrogenase